jgi:hypothetical protein
LIHGVGFVCRALREACSSEVDGTGGEEERSIAVANDDPGTAETEVLVREEGSTIETDLCGKMLLDGAGPAVSPDRSRCLASSLVVVKRRFRSEPGRREKVLVLELLPSKVGVPCAPDLSLGLVPVGTIGSELDPAGLEDAVLDPAIMIVARSSIKDLAQRRQLDRSRPSRSEAHEPSGDG